MKDRTDYNNIFKAYVERKDKKPKGKKLQQLNENICDFGDIADEVKSMSSMDFDQPEHARFTDDVLNMTLRDLFNQVKGTDEGLYRKLVYYVYDKFHEDPSQGYEDPCEPGIGEFSSCEEEPITIARISAVKDFDDVMDNMPVRGMGRRMRWGPRYESMRKKRNFPDTKLLIEAYKAKKKLKK